MINLWKVPKWVKRACAWLRRCPPRSSQEARTCLRIEGNLGQPKHELQRTCIDSSLALRMTSRALRYLCSKSTGAVTSCTRKYFASAGYFRATASYIAYATLR